MLLKIKYNAIQLLFILNSVFVFANVDNIVLKSDSLKLSNHQDSILTISKLQSNTIKDTVENNLANSKDTILFKLDKRFGSVYLLDNSFIQTVNKYQGLETNYGQISELLSNEINYYPNFQGSFGLYDNFLAFGGGHRDNSFRLNGRNIISPDSRIYSLNDFSPEAFENIQIMTGSEASVIGGASGGLFFNIQEIQYNSKTPFTKLWYSDAGKDLLSSDGIFSQNIMANTNFTFGFRRMSTIGEFINQSLDSWNVRSSLRHSFNEYTNLVLSYNLANVGNGTNGGISLSSSNVFSRLDAIPNYNDLNERNIKNDITLTFQSRLFNDSLFLYKTNLYYSRNERSNSITDNFKLDTSYSNLYFYFDSYYGVNIQAEKKLLNTFTLISGIELEKTNIDQTQYHSNYSSSNLSVYGFIKNDFSNSLKLNGGIRLSKIYDKSSLNLGGNLIYQIKANNYLKVDLSISDRVPSLLEGLNLKNERSTLFLLEYTNKDSIQSFLKIEGFFRITDNIIINESILNNGIIVNTISKNSFSKQSYGANINFKYKLLENYFKKRDELYLNTNLQLNFSSYDSLRNSFLPVFYFKFTPSYKFYVNHSSLVVGMNFLFLSSFKGMSYIPFNNSYLINNSESGSMMNGIDIFAVAKLGNAHVKISFQNIANSGYFFQPYYPMLNRNIRFSVSWSFFD